MKIIGVIPARYESTRFPGKPLALICGKPMIWWVYQQVVKVKSINEIYVATDDIRIATMCEQNDMKVIMTSCDHQTGTDRVAEIASYIDGDLFLNIQGDEPIIQCEMIQQIIDAFATDNSACVVTLKKRISNHKEIIQPSTVKVVTDKYDRALYFSRSVIPMNKNGEIPEKIYKHIGIYGYQKDFLIKFPSMAQTKLELIEGIELLRALENGYKILVKETQFESVGVDLPEHIEIVEKVLRAKANYS